MEIPNKDLEEFKKIIREDYGANLSDKEAHRLANKVLNLFKIIYRPIPKPGEKVEDPYV